VDAYHAKEETDFNNQTTDEDDSSYTSFVNLPLQEAIDFDIGSDDDSDYGSFQPHGPSDPEPEESDEDSDEEPPNVVSWPTGYTEPEDLESLASGAVGVTQIDSAVKVLKDIAAYGKLPISDELIAEVEALVALFFTLSGCEDLPAAFGAIFLYIRSWFDSSVTKQITDYINELFANEPQGPDTPNDGEVEMRYVDQAELQPEWLKLVRSVRENWSAVKGNKLFDHFSKLLGLIVCTGLCKASSLTFSVKEYKMFEPDLKLVHGDATDIADAAFGTVTFFVENMYMCYQEKSLAPLLISDRSASEIDEEFSNIVLYWSLVKNGNLYKVAKVSEKEFDRRLEALATRMKNMLGAKSGTFEKKLIQDKFMRLLQIKNDYITLKVSTGVRKAPYCLEFVGESSQGKTTICDQLCDALLASCDLPLDKEYRCTLNADDEFWANWTSAKLILNLDDAANIKAGFIGKPHTQIIDEVANNSPYVAKMAELDQKGKVFVEPEIMTVTTNVKHLDAGTYSNCPYSIQRRMHSVITVKAKPEFQFELDGQPQGLDSAKVRAHYEKLGIEPVFDDIWTVTVEKAVKPAELTDVAKYEVVTWKGQPLEDVPIKTLIQYSIEQFHLHRVNQDDIVKRMKDRAGKVVRCPASGCCQIEGYCDEHDGKQYDEDGKEFFPAEEVGPHMGREPEYGDKLVTAITDSTSDITTRLKKDLFGYGETFEAAASTAMLAAAKAFAQNWDWMWIIPTPWLKSGLFQNVVMFGYRGKLRSRVLRSMTFNLLQGIFFMYVVYAFLWGWLRVLMICVIITTTYLRQTGIVEKVKDEFRQELIDRNVVAASLKEFRDKHGGKLVKASAIIAALYTIAKVYRKFKEDKAQGSLVPKTEAEIAKRDAESNPYTEVVHRPLPPSRQSTTTSAEQFEKLVEKNLLYGTILKNGERYLANSLFVRSNLCIIPQHYFENDMLEIDFRFAQPDASGGKFVARLDRANSYFVPETDLALCYCANGGSFKDLRCYFPNGKMPAAPFHLKFRQKSGEMVTATGTTVPGMADNRVRTFEGGAYKNLSIETFEGLCGAPILGMGSVRSILGFHLGGRAGTPQGCYGALTQQQIQDGMSDLSGREGVLFTGAAEVFEPQVMGVKVITGTQLHEKHPLNFLPDDSQLKYHGNCGSLTNPRSRVTVSPTSEHVLDVCGVPNTGMPPKMRPRWWGAQKCLSNMAVPAHPYPAGLLELAIKDYKEPLIPIFSGRLWRNARPLTEQENLCGIPGKRFMDGMKLGTAPGYPLTGIKADYIEELDPTDEEPVRRRLKPEIRSEVDRCETCYKNGERANCISKCCEKDEIVTKEKCRMYFANPMALTFLVRKYFLPLLRILQFNPLVGECAVGINAHGEEWEQLHQHVHTFGSDRIFGGDYGKYDQKLPSQLIIAAIRILIDFARCCDYSEEDLRVMEAMAGDIVFAYVQVHGELISLTEGTHISGNSLTVFINSICGSLNLRCYYYANNPPKDLESKTPFREVVKLMCYGDDNIASVSKKLNNFTIRGASEFLAKYGQVYTMPDKESELADFLEDGEFEFLKRKSVYHEALGIHVGALIEPSIFKSLHNIVKKDLMLEQVAAINLDGAAREWFNHGPEVYEKRRVQMKEVGTRAGILHMTNDLDLTYEDRVEAWKEKYGAGYELWNYVMPDDAYDPGED
jgi:hypothetical protein